MTDTEVPTAPGPWAALTRARAIYTRVAFFIGIALVLYALYVFLRPIVVPALRMKGSADLWRTLIFNWKGGVLFHPVFFQQAVLVFATGMALISRNNAWRWGTVVLGVAIGAITIVDNWPLAQVVARYYPFDFHIPAAILLALLVLPRGHAAASPRPTTLSRTVGLLVLFHGIAALAIMAIDPVLLRMLLTDLSRNFPHRLFVDIRYIVIPVAIAFLLVGSGIAIALRRPWAPIATILATGMGLYLFADTRTFGYRQAGSFGAPHLHQIVMFLALGYLALTLRRKQEAAAVPRPETPIPATDPIVTVPDDTSWAEALRPILARDDHLAPKYRSVWVPWLLLALIILTWAPIVGILPKIFVFHDRQILAFHIQMLLSGIGLGLVDPAIRLLGRRILGLRAARAQERLKPPDPQRPILYLRSFRLDETYDRPPTLREMFLARRGTDSAEQIMTRELDTVGPVIAIGRPGETIPPVGAARFYSTDETWRDKVANAAAAADFVVWTTGFGAGLAWEIDYLQRHVPRERLIIWAHPHLLRIRRSKREAEWQKFAAAFATKFAKPLPTALGAARFFRLAEDGTLTPIPTPHWSLRILLFAPWRSLESMRQAMAARTIARMRTNGTIGRSTAAAH